MVAGTAGLDRAALLRSVVRGADGHAVTDYAVLEAIEAGGAALALKGAPWARGRAALFARQKERVRLAAWRRWLPLAVQRLGHGGAAGGDSGNGAMDIDEGAAAAAGSGVATAPAPVAATVAVDAGASERLSMEPVRFALKALAVDSEKKAGQRGAGRQVHKAFQG